MKQETLLTILKCASRAPSTHNSQPWNFKIDNNDGYVKLLTVYYDKKRCLSVVDKDKRYLYISIGCMLGNLEIASRKYGFVPKFDFNILDNKICDISFDIIKVDNHINDRLFEKIESRINSRGIFEDREVEESVLNESKKIIEDFINKNQEMGLCIKIITEKEKINNIALLAERSVGDIYSKKDFREEFSFYLNSNKSRKTVGIHGYSLNLSNTISLLLPLAMRHLNLGSILSKVNYKSIKSSPSCFAISSNSEFISYVKVGMISERLMLFLQSNEVDTSIFTALIDSKSHKEFEDICGLTGRSQFFFCAGYFPANINRVVSVREDIEEKILK